MYLPAQFEPGDQQHALALMHAYSFASLISTDEAGLPHVTHLPIHSTQAPDGLLLLGHVARANPHWRYLQARPQALVVFSGPHACQSPQVYPDAMRVLVTTSPITPPNGAACRQISSLNCWQASSGLNCA
jgi:transcriptional regulator